MKIKVCGMKNPENIVEVGSLLPDFMGFIFWQQSPRFFDGIIPELPKTIQKVGVFVDATTDEINSRIKQHQLNFVQLHGQESPQFCKALKSKNIKIIKVFSIANDFDFGVLEPFEEVCDHFLFDTKGKMPGGNGIAFNWQILKNYPFEKPFFLSGGIGLDDLEKIKKLDLPIFAVDVNSKFETNPGQKNISLLKQFQSQLHELSR